jgi:hypothetical protein
MLKNWKTVYFKDYRPWYASIGLVVIFLTFNSYILITFGVVVPSNSSDTNSTVIMKLECFEVPNYPQTKFITYYGPVSEIGDLILLKIFKLKNHL